MVVHLTRFGHKLSTKHTLKRLYALEFHSDHNTCEHHSFFVYFIMMMLCTLNIIYAILLSCRIMHMKWSWTIQHYLDSVKMQSQAGWRWGAQNRAHRNRENDDKVKNHKRSEKCDKPVFTMFFFLDLAYTSSFHSN